MVISCVVQRLNSTNWNNGSSAVGLLLKQKTLLPGLINNTTCLDILYLV